MSDADFAPAAAERSDHTAPERWLHRLAFAGGAGLQTVAADVEDLLWGRRLEADAQAAATAPLFVCGLPRAGSTLLLELLDALPVFAGHTYRDLPWLGAPLLWGACSRSFRRDAGDSGRRPRAHGDGMTVGYDSPEAFEEAFWRRHWPERYRGDRIAWWTATDPDLSAPRGQEFGESFRRQMRKVVCQRARERGLDPRRIRYLSKNNGNICRLPALRRLFPEAVLLTPFRSPAAQARSLRRTHLRFLERHRRDPFARRYMADAGHYDFGANLKPVTGAAPEPGAAAPAAEAAAAGGAAWWLRYWLRVYGRLLADRPATGALPVSYDRLCAQPVAELERIAAAAGLEPPDCAALLAQSGRLETRPAAAADGTDEALPADLVAAAREVHAALLDAAR